VTATRISFCASRVAEVFGRPGRRPRAAGREIRRGLQCRGAADRNLARPSGEGGIEPHRRANFPSIKSSLGYLDRDGVGASCCDFPRTGEQIRDG
jgi:hypothetical protein